MVLFLGILAFPFPGLEPAARRTAAVAALMAAWWMSEALPLAATALLPLVLFPGLGVLSPGEAAAPYANPVIFLFLGGFILALALERWDLHRRMALAVVARAGADPARLVLAVMAVTAFLSMWISNTATAAMMLPLGIALVHMAAPSDTDAPAAGTGPAAGTPFGAALMLGIAYAATIGGLGTLIGTPPNAVMAATASEILGVEVGFARWLMLGLPTVAILLPVTWAVLVFALHPQLPLAPGAVAALEEERSRLGSLGLPGRRTIAVFVITVLAWLTREPKQLGGFVVPGLEQLFPGLHDATIAVAAAIALFTLPSGAREGGRLMDWSTARQLPWGVLLLFGGGLSLAEAMQASGLTATIGGLFSAAAGLPTLGMVAAVAALLVLLSELASNTAIAAMAMPLLAGVAVATGQDPLVLMAAGALASSAAFMLPVATPPNAIVFGSGQIAMRQMVRAGVWLNLVAWVVISVLATLLGEAALG